MISPQLLRNQLDAVCANLKRRGYILDTVKLQALEERRRELQGDSEQKRAQRNDKSSTIGELQQILMDTKHGIEKREKWERESGHSATPEFKERLVKEVAKIKEELQEREKELAEVQEQIQTILYDIPNLLHDSVPDGQDDSDNAEVRRWQSPPDFGFEPLDHVALGEGLQLMDFTLAARLASARFVTMQGALARLHRALAQFMLDLHINRHGYREVYMPFLANPTTLTGTGQLPKFEEDLFRAERDGLYLIPTAEVVVTNIVQGEIVAADELPMKFVCHTPCFRREAGSYGRDTRGMLRQHQFEKVELVHITAPEESYPALEELTANAEAVLQALELPYRTVALCSGDIGFAAAKTYDIEVWMPGQNTYREISSCSNCEDFQARRMQARFRRRSGKPELLHTLNGSGIAVGRAMIAVMENYQQADGSIIIPPVLRSYMGGAERITTEASLAAE